MGVLHAELASIRNLTTDDPVQLIIQLMSLVEHVGIGQFRVGNVTMSTPDTTRAITFVSELEPKYEVFFQVGSNVSTVIWATDTTHTGFTLNLSPAVDAVISFIAVQASEPS